MKISDVLVKIKNEFTPTKKLITKKFLLILKYLINKVHTNKLQYLQIIINK